MDNDGSSAHAGGVAKPVAEDAGGVQATRDDGQAAATPKAQPASAGCAATLATGAASTQATPPQTVREFERALRALGFTRMQAASIARQGFSGAATATHRPEPSETDQLRDALQKFAHVFEGSSSS